MKARMPFTINGNFAVPYVEADGYHLSCFWANDGVICRTKSYAMNRLHDTLPLVERYGIFALDSDAIRHFSTPHIRQHVRPLRNHRDLRVRAIFRQTIGHRLLDARCRLDVALP